MKLKRYELIARLEGSDLTKWQSMMATEDAMQLRPDWYSVSEAERHFLQRRRFEKEIADRLEIDAERAWTVTPNGNVCYDNEPPGD